MIRTFTYGYIHVLRYTTMYLYAYTYDMLTANNKVGAA